MANPGDNMTDYLDLACIYLGIEGEKVLDYAITADEVVVVVDNGIKGCPKYRIPLSELITATEPQPEPVIAVAEPLPVPAAIDLGLDDGLSYRDLQALAIDAGIPANQKKDDLRQALEDLTDG